MTYEQGYPQGGSQEDSRPHDAATDTDFRLHRRLSLPSHMDDEYFL